MRYMSTAPSPSTKQAISRGEAVYEMQAPTQSQLRQSMKSSAPGETNVDHVAQLLASAIHPKCIDTSLTYDDLVLDSETLQGVEHVLALARLQTKAPTTAGITQRQKPAVLSLFHGPPGTGKTLTTCLIGKMLDRPVYHVDLSTIVSKDLDETTTKLTNLLGNVHLRDGLLLLDDRSNILFLRDVPSSMRDENVSCLLQHVEAFPGLVIMRTNLQDVSSTFTDYFQCTISFGMPGFNNRLRLWTGCFGSECPMAPEIDLLTIAREYILSGGSIVNAFRYACVRRLERSPAVITQTDLLDGIQHEIQVLS